MKKIALIFSLIFVLMLLIVGCTQQSTISSKPKTDLVSDKKTVSEKQASTATAIATPSNTTETDLSKVEQQITTSDAIDTELNMSELDSLDQDLNFEI